MSESCPIVIVGVGGQGVISLARLLGRAATDVGLEARVGQIYGLSQRGGSVEATVRIGPGSTAFISPNEAKVVVGLEPLEAERALPKMSPEATVLVNQTPIIPTGMTLSRSDYPDLSSIVSRIDEIARIVHVVDGTALARKVGNVRLLNIVMLGALAGIDLLPVPGSALASAVERVNTSTGHAAKTQAFGLGEELGREAVASSRPTTPSATGHPGRHPSILIDQGRRAGTGKPQQSE